MSAIKNLVIESDDQSELTRLADEYKFIGREAELDLNNGRLTVLALPKSYKKKRAAEAKLAAKRLAEEEDFSY